MNTQHEHAAKNVAKKSLPTCETCGTVICNRKSKQCRQCWLKTPHGVPAYAIINCIGCGRAAKKRCWNSRRPKYCSRDCFFESIRIDTPDHELKRKREYARNRGSTKHRTRCRKFGCFYNPKVTRLAVLRAGLWRCYICGTKVSDDLPANHKRKATIDHIVPLEKGGPHDWHNVKACCRRCNTKKQAQWDGQNVFNFSSGWEHVNG